MKLIINKNQLLKTGSVIILNFFITKLLIGLAGLKFKEINYSICKTDVYYKDSIRAHFSTYFSVKSILLN